MAWEPYFENRKALLVKNDLALYGRVRRFWQAQKGKCPICHGDFTLVTGWHMHRVIPKLQGGKDVLSNLQLLHPICHRQLHKQDCQYVADPSLTMWGF